MSCSFLSVIVIDVCLECGELENYRTLCGASQPRGAARARVFADCRRARQSGGRLENGNLGMLYLLAKSTLQCRVMLHVGAVHPVVAVRGLRHGHLRVPNRKPAQPGCRPRGRKCSHGGTATGLRPNPRGELIWQ
ncbi:conserved protein of unknown function [Burkholderia multivorans]